MEGSASVRRALCGTLVAANLNTVALRQQPEEQGIYNRKVLEEEEYIEVTVVDLVDLMLSGYVYVYF